MDDISFMSTEGARFQGGSAMMALQHVSLYLIGAGLLAGNLYAKGCSTSKKELLGQDVSQVPILCRYDEWESTGPILGMLLLAILMPMVNVNMQVQHALLYAFVAYGGYQLVSSHCYCSK